MTERMQDELHKKDCMIGDLVKEKGLLSQSVDEHKKALIRIRGIALGMSYSDKQSDILHCASVALYPHLYNDEGQRIGRPKTFEATYKCTCRSDEACNYCTSHLAAPKEDEMKCKDCKFLVRRGNDDWECVNEEGGFHMEDMTYSCSIPDGFVLKEEHNQDNNN